MLAELVEELCRDTEASGFEQEIAENTEKELSAT
jgi:hypothetical protein